MNRLLLLTALASPLLGPAVGRADGPGSAGPATALDLRRTSPPTMRASIRLRAPLARSGSPSSPRNGPA